jgi:hypothetical protein
MLSPRGGLAGESEHHLVGDVVRVVDHCEAVAGQRSLGEDVEEGDAASHARIIVDRSRALFSPPDPSITVLS